jgi:hypothetical protein
MDETNKTKPAIILTEKLVINTFILGTAFPRTANDILMMKFKAIKGAAIKTPKTKTLDTSLTYSTMGLAWRKKVPIGRSSKLKVNALITS